jgi:hypothetical protein
MPASSTNTPVFLFPFPRPGLLRHLILSIVTLDLSCPQPFWLQLLLVILNDFSHFFDLSFAPKV